MATIRELAAAAQQASIALHSVLEVYPLDDDPTGEVERACRGADAAVWILGEVREGLEAHLGPGE